MSLVLSKRSGVNIGSVQMIKDKSSHSSTTDDDCNSLPYMNCGLALRKYTQSDTVDDAINFRLFITGWLR